MENKHVGFLVIGIAVVMAFMVYLFNTGMNSIVNATCSHGPSCSMYDTIRNQTGISIALIAIIVVIGIVLVFSKPKERVFVEKVKVHVKEKKKKIDLNGLDKDEKKVIKLLQEEGNAIFQATLMEKLEIGKVKTTRLLDKLEAKQLIERKRRGMNNVVVLKTS